MRLNGTGTTLRMAAAACSALLFTACMSDAEREFRSMRAFTQWDDVYSVSRTATTGKKTVTCQFRRDGMACHVDGKRKVIINQDGAFEVQNGKTEQLLAAAPALRVWSDGLPVFGQISGNGIRKTADGTFEMDAPSAGTPLTARLKFNPEGDVVSRELVSGAEALIRVSYSDYREVSGKHLPFRIRQEASGSKYGNIETVVREWKIDPELPDEMFRLSETSQQSKTSDTK